MKWNKLYVNVSHLFLSINLKPFYYFICKLIVLIDIFSCCTTQIIQIFLNLIMLLYHSIYFSSDLPSEFFFNNLGWLFFTSKLFKDYFFNYIFEHPWNMFMQLDIPVVIKLYFKTK